MTINERIKYFRKDILHLNQTEFALNLGMKQTSVSTFERIGATVTEQTIKALCLAFNVNETWLRTGEGEMFIEVSENDEYTKAAESIAQNNDIEIMSLLVEYWKLDDTSKTIFKNFLRNVSERINENSKQHHHNVDIPMDIPNEEELQKYVIDVDDIDENDPNIHPDIRKHIVSEKKKRNFDTQKEIG